MAHIYLLEAFIFHIYVVMRVIRATMPGAYRGRILGVDRGADWVCVVGVVGVVCGVVGSRGVAL